MLFNSLEFALFFVLVYGLYLVLPLRGQNLLLLAASYLFYGWWDWRFLSLIVVTTQLDYLCGSWIASAQSPARKRALLLLSMSGNLGMLGFFKYYGFFAESLNALMMRFGLGNSIPVLNIVLPVGISFYTFQTMSYTIDIYRGTLAPARNWVDFYLFVTFFPQLVAGPIERAADLLPQVAKARTVRLEKIYEGAHLFFWGLFEKVYVADSLARVVDPLFAEAGAGEGIRVLLGTYAFAFQIFCDFDGYSNMALGLGKALGFELTTNFRLPYFAANPSEFWQRWHITLSQWLRDYLYIPLGGNRNGTGRTYRNLALTMLLGGLWHGAAWTFVIWGALHGLYLIGHRLLAPRLMFRLATGRLARWGSAFVFFHLVCIAWIFFRAESLAQAWAMVGAVCTTSRFLGVGAWTMLEGILPYLLPLLLVQVLQAWKGDLLALLRLPSGVRAVVYFILYFLMVTQGVQGGKEFIYFQF